MAPESRACLLTRLSAAAQLLNCCCGWPAAAQLPSCSYKRTHCWLQVCGIEWCPYELTHGSTSQFVTFGKKHIKLWQAGAAGAYMPTQLSFGKLPLQNVHSAAWLAPTGPHKQCQLLAGMDDGQIYVFKVGGVPGRAATDSVDSQRAQLQQAQMAGQSVKLLLASALADPPRTCHRHRAQRRSEPSARTSLDPAPSSRMVTPRTLACAACASARAAACCSVAAPTGWCSSGRWPMATSGTGAWRGRQSASSHRTLQRRHPASGAPLLSHYCKRAEALTWRFANFAHIRMRTVQLQCCRPASPDQQVPAAERWTGTRAAARSWWATATAACGRCLQGAAR